MEYKVLTFDWNTHRQLADNIWHAQMAGHPKILTYAGPYLGLQTRQERRKDAMSFEHDDVWFKIPQILSRDEYPFACTHEGGKASWVGHIPGAENSAQGGLIAAFLRRNGIIAGEGERSKFVVAVKNHKNGPVTKSCQLSKPAADGTYQVCVGCTVDKCRFTKAGGFDLDRL